MYYYKKSKANTFPNMTNASLFVGRWQPFHKGHKALIESVLKTGKPVIVAIRNTEISKKNPYSTNERWEMISKALKKHSHLLRIVVLPNDIDEICIGRDVGYNIRKIELPLGKQKISGTKIRKTLVSHPIYWLTGQSGAGKSTLAFALQKKIGGTVLDGDEMRKSVSLGLGFSKADREENNLRVARLALTLCRQAPVIVSVIAPFEDTRRKIDAILEPTWVYIARTIAETKDKPYEIPKKPHISLNTDKQTVEEGIAQIIKYENKKIGSRLLDDQSSLV